MNLSSIAGKTSWCVLLVVFFLTYEAKAQDLANIVIILADDLGYGDVGFNGCPDLPDSANDQR